VVNDNLLKKGFVVMVIDIHAHITRTKTTTRENGRTYTTPAELLKIMKREGIDKAVLLPMPTPEGNHRIVSTEDVLEITAEYPDRFIPFCNIDPRAINNSENTNFLPHLEYYKQAGCKGLGEMMANLPFDDPLVENLFAQCEAAEMPVLFHIGPRYRNCYGLIDDLHLPKLEAALQKFPNLIFIGHSQPFWSEISADVTEENRNSYPKGKVISGRVPELLRKYPNLYCDLSAGSGYNAVSRDPEFGYDFIEEFQDRLMFGTDVCYPDQETPLTNFLREALERGKISLEIYEKVMWRNADRILSLGLE